MPGIAEKTFVTVSLILFSEAIVPKLFRGHGDLPGILQGYLPSYADYMTIVIFGTVYLAVFSYLFFNRNRWYWFVTLVKDNWFLILPVIWTALSCFWSLSPGVTFRRSVALLCTTGFGIYLGGRFDIGDQIRFLSVAIFFVAVLSLLYILFTPWGVHINEEYSGLWMGAFIHKNALSRVMCLGIIAWFCLPKRQMARARERLVVLWHYLSILLFFVLLIKSRGITSIVALGFMLVAYSVYRSLTASRLLRNALICSWLVFIMIGTVFVGSYLNEILGVLGKDVTLTGRVQLWEILISFMLKRPWSGYGFGTVMDPESPLINTIWGTAGWEPGNAHNGWIQLYLDMGVIGSVPVVYILANFIYHAYHFMLAKTDGLPRFWPLLFITLLLILNCTIDLLFSQHSLYWILIVSTLVTMRQRMTYGELNRGIGASVNLQGSSSRAV